MQTIQEKLEKLVRDHVRCDDHICQWDIFRWNVDNVLKVRTFSGIYFFRSDVEDLADVLKQFFTDIDCHHEYINIPTWYTYIPGNHRFIELATVDGIELLSGNWVQKIN